MKRNHVKISTPGAYEALLALEKYGEGIKSISPALKSLIKIRASQINKCNYCIDLHTKEAKKVNEGNIDYLNDWRNTNVFTIEEQLALQVTEEVTLIHNNGLTDETYLKCVGTFGEKTTVELIMLVIIINSWNRIAIATNL